MGKAKALGSFLAGGWVCGRRRAVTEKHELMIFKQVFFFFFFSLQDDVGWQFSSVGLPSSKTKAGEERLGSK